MYVIAKAYLILRYVMHSDGLKQSPYEAGEIP